jgi:hypothetical protein
VVALSYFQTLHSYSNGGGSFSVARANLGTWPGLTAGAALLVGYLLTAAVSLTAAVEAIASAFPALWTARVGWALALLLIIMFINLRGTREAGALMSVPVYGFLGVFLAMLAYGAVRASLFGAGPAEIDLVADRRWISGSCCGPSPRGARPSPASRPSATACLPSGRRRHATRGRPSSSWRGSWPCSLPAASA